MTDPTPQVTCFVQTNMVGMSFGDIVTLARTPYVDALIAGGRLLPDTDPTFPAVLAENSAQPVPWSLLDTATSAASPAAPVTPATAVLSQPEVAAEPAPVDPAPVAEPAPVDPAPVAEPAPVDPAPADPAPADPAV